MRVVHKSAYEGYLLATLISFYIFTLGKEIVRERKREWQIERVIELEKI